MPIRIATGLAILLLICFNAFLRSPVVDDIFCDPDVAGAAYSSQEFSAGGTIYDRCVETKPPASYMLFSALFGLFGKTMSAVNGFSIVYHALLMVLLFMMGRRISGTGGAIVAVWLYSLYSVNASANGICPNFETWTLLPTAGAFALVLSSSDNPRGWKIALAGGCIAIAILFKQTAALFLPGLFLAMATDDHRAGKSWRLKARLLRKDAALFIAGFGAPILIVVAIFAMRGGLSTMAHALNPFENIGYASSGHWIEIVSRIQENVGFFAKRTVFLSVFTALLLPAWFLSIKKQDASERSARRIVGWWLGFALLSVLAGMKFFDHYFVVLFPPIVLACGFAIKQILEAGFMNRAMKVLLLALVIALPLADARPEIGQAIESAQMRMRAGSQGWTEGSRYYYGATTLPRYWAWNKELEKAGICIREKTSRADTIFVWDYIPEIYWFADRRAPTRHFMYFDVAWDLPPGSGRWHSAATRKLRAGREELMMDLKTTMPSFIVRINDRQPGDIWNHFNIPARMFDDLEQFVGAHYEPNEDCTTKYVMVYGLKTKTAD